MVQINQDSVSGWIQNSNYYKNWLLRVICFQNQATLIVLQCLLQKQQQKDF